MLELETERQKLLQDWSVLEKVIGAAKDAGAIADELEPGDAPEPKKQATKPVKRKRKSNEARKKPTEEKLQRTLQGMRSLNSSQPFTFNDLAEVVAMDKTTLRYALIELERQGVVRGVGRLPKQPGQQGPPRLGYVLAGTAPSLPSLPPYAPGEVRSW